jgi:hypothetical protein
MRFMAAFGEVAIAAHLEERIALRGEEALEPLDQSLTGHLYPS